MAGENQDLFTALNMLKQSSQELSLTRAISDANEQMQTAKMQIGDEAQKMQAARDIASQLTMRMLQSGANGLQLEAANKAITQPPPNVQNTLEGFVNPLTRGATEQYMAGQHANAMELARLKGRQDKTLAMALREGDHADSEMAKLVQMDPAEKARTATGQAVQNLQRAQNIYGLIGAGKTVKELDEKDQVFVQDAVLSTARLLQNGVVSEGELKKLFPKTADMDKAAMVRYLTGKPQPANAGAFLKMFLEIAEREANISEAFLFDSVTRTAKGKAHIAALKDQNGNLREPQFKEVVSEWYQTHAHVPVTPDMIKINPKTHEFKLDLGKDQADIDAEMVRVKSAKRALKDPKVTPEIREKARAYFSSLGVNATASVSDIQRKLEIQALRERDK